MSEELSLTEELQKSLKNLSAASLETLADIRSETVGTVLLEEALRAIGMAGLRYREACRSRSKSEYYAGLLPVVECLETQIYWLNMTLESGVLESEQLAPIIAQARETQARFTAARISSSRRSKD